MKYPPVHYHDYLGIPSILAAQKLRSAEFGKPAHEEMLFIIVHQTYELWFKQMLFELGSILEILKASVIEEKRMGTAVSRLERVRDIQTHIIGQIDLMETMTPLDFLDFREYLYPASGFQSFQWRLLETKLGLKTEQRFAFSEAPFWKALHPTQQDEMQKILNEPSMFDVVQSWLERTPFLSREGYSFWKTYQETVLNVLKGDEEVVKTNPRLSPADQEKSLKMLEMTRAGFLNLFDPDKFTEFQKQGAMRLSNKALQAALFIQIYRDEPILQLPFRLLETLVDLDEKMTEWRYRHSLMVQRMLGRKIGTGGSSGHDYLKTATEQHKIFSDLMNLSSYLIPRSQIPELPEELRKEMNFYFRSV